MSSAFITPTATDAPIVTPLPLPTSASTVAPTPSATPAPQPTPLPDLPSASAFLDVDWYRTTLINTTDLFNGGRNGRSGMGAYRRDFTGCFHVNLNRQWEPIRQTTSTSIAQSRAIYINVETYRAVDPGRGDRYLRIVNQGVDCLLNYFWDAEYGGFYWQIWLADGEVADTQKQGYGNVHPLFVLAQAYSITHNPKHLQAALDQLAIIEERFLDPDYPGGIRPGLDRDMTQVIGVNNVDTFTHYFEALLALYDVTEGVERDHVAELIRTAGNFLVNQLARAETGHPDRLYVAYNYDEHWDPSQEPYTRETQWSGALQASTGHGVELAYLLSRAVERGFDPAWLQTGDGLMNFVTVHAIDATTGGMLYEITDYDGQPLFGNPDNDKFIWWAQSESARAFLHLAVVRGEDYAAPFKAIEQLIHGPLTDPEYGGWYDWVQVGSLNTGGLDKGNVWKVNYHYTMFFAEVLRLAEQYPDRLPELAAQVGLQR